MYIIISLCLDKRSILQSTSFGPTQDSDLWAVFAK